MLLVNLTGFTIVYELSTQFAHLLFGRLRWKEFALDVMPKWVFVHFNKPQSPSSRNVRRTVTSVAVQMCIYSHYITFEIGIGSMFDSGLYQLTSPESFTSSQLSENVR